MNLEQKYKLQQLFEIYKNLLTDHQREIFCSYYFDDLSLSEIAENLQVSRQAVKDILDRCEKSLLCVEEDLMICDKNDKILASLKNLITDEKLTEIKNIIYKRK